MSHIQNLSYLTSKDQILAAQLVSVNGLESNRFYLNVGFSDTDWSEFLSFLRNLGNNLVGSYEIPEGVPDNSNCSIIWLKNAGFIIYSCDEDNVQKWIYYKAPKLPSYLRD